jgi:release factor glutamine methyltransferase
MNIAAALQQGKSRLFYAEVETPLLDATLLLSEALGKSKELLLASLPDPVAEEGLQRFHSFLQMRCSGLPVSYIRRKKEFYSLEFYVDERVMVPRPETELLVEEALAILKAVPGLKRVHDACTGSGCVAVALKSSLPELEVSASDFLPEALEVAAINIRRLLQPPDRGRFARRLRRRAPVRLHRSDLLSRVPGRYDLITANPPYLSDLEAENMRKAGWPEPQIALRGGADGTDLLRRLIRQAPRKLSSSGYLLLEAAAGQMKGLAAELAAQGFEEIVVAPDLAGRGRLIRGRLGSYGGDRRA